MFSHTMWPEFNRKNICTYYNKRNTKFDEYMNSKHGHKYISGQVVYATDMHFSRGNTSLYPKQTSSLEANCDASEAKQCQREIARPYRRHRTPVTNTITQTTKASVELSMSQLSELSHLKKEINHMHDIIKRKKARQHKTEHESMKHKGSHRGISKDRIKLVQSQIIRNFQYSVQKDKNLAPREIVDIKRQDNTRDQCTYKKLCRNVKCSCHCRHLNSFAWHARERPLRVYTTARGDEVVPAYKPEKRYAMEVLNGYLCDESNKAMQTNVLYPSNKVFTTVRLSEESAYVVRDYNQRCNRHVCGAKVNMSSSSGDDVCCSNSSETDGCVEPRVSMKDASCGCRKDEFKEYSNVFKKDNKNTTVPLKRPETASIVSDSCVEAQTISRDKSNINSSHASHRHCNCEICEKLISDFISTLPRHNRDLVPIAGYNATKQRKSLRSNVSKDSGCDCTACGNVHDFTIKLDATNKNLDKRKCSENCPKRKNDFFSSHKVAKRTYPVYSRNTACSPMCSTTVVLIKGGRKTKIHHNSKGTRTVSSVSSSASSSRCMAKTDNKGILDKLCKIFHPKSRDKSPSSTIKRNAHAILNEDKNDTASSQSGILSSRRKAKVKKQDASSKLAKQADDRKEEKLNTAKEKKTGKTKGGLEDKASKESTDYVGAGSSKKIKKGAKVSNETIHSTSSAEGDKKDKKNAKGKKGSKESVSSKSSDEGKKNKKDKKMKHSIESIPTENVNKSKKNKKTNHSQVSLTTASIKDDQKGKNSKVVKPKKLSKGIMERKKGKESKEKSEIKASGDKKDKKANKSKGKESTESVQSKVPDNGKNNKKKKKNKGSEESVQSKLSEVNKKGKKGKAVKDVTVVVDGKKVKRGKSSNTESKVVDNNKNKKGSKEKTAKGIEKNKESVALKEKETGKKSKKEKDKAAKESGKNGDKGKKVNKGKNDTGVVSKDKMTHTFKRGGMEIVVMSSTSSSCTIICEPEPNCITKFCNLLKGM